MRNWEKAERKISLRIKGRRTPGSGNGIRKGDILTDKYCIEVKETSKPGMTIHMDWFTKLLLEGSVMHRKCALILELSNGENLCFVETEDSELIDMGDASTFTLKSRLLGRRLKDVSNASRSTLVSSIQSPWLSSGDIIKIRNTNWKVMSLDEFNEEVHSDDKSE
jgi:hypothetical protein